MLSCIFLLAISRKMTSTFRLMPELILRCLWCVAVAATIMAASVPDDMCACTEYYTPLMEFYNATNGPQWTVRTGWGYVNNCTVSWFGVTCTSTSLILSLPSNSLSGTLPDSLSQIVTLQTLNLNLNKIQGTLPASWKTLVKLSSLNIMNNALNGTLPDAWKTMFLITTLYLANNNLTGKLPASWGGPWRSINSIDVHSNSLSGTIPTSWVNMTTLTGLYIQSNCLYGAIPAPLAQQGTTFSICQTKVTFENLILACTGWPSYCYAVLSHSATMDSRLPGEKITPSRTNTSGLEESGSSSHTRSRTLSPITPSASTLSQRLTASSASRSVVTASRSASSPNTESAAWNCGLQNSATIELKGVAIKPHTGLLVNLSSTVVAVVVSERAVLATAVEEQHSLLTGTIVTSSITRDVIALTPTLVLNVSMTPHPQAPVMRPWAVSNITLASGMQLRWTSMTDAPWVTLLAIEPPLEGGGRAWISSQTQLLASVTISLRIYFTCEGRIPALMLDVNIPAPGVTRDLAAQVEAVGQYSQIVSILAGGASSGSSLGRVMSTRSMVMCDADSAVGGGVVGFGVNICDDDEGKGGAITSARSAIVDNIILVGVVVAALSVAVFLWFMVDVDDAATLRGAMFNFCIPSSLFPVWTAVLPSTAAAATLLFARLGKSTSCSTTGDAIIAVCGATLSIVPEVALLHVWYRYTGSGGGQRTPKWVCYERSAHPASNPIDKAINIDVDPAPDGVSSINQSSRNHDANATLIAPPSRVMAMWNRGMRRDWTWVGIHMEPAWVMLLDYRLLWFSALDTGILVLVSVAAVAGGLDASQHPALCYSLTSVVIGLQVMEAVMVIVVKPFTTLFSAVHTFGTLILTSLSAAAQLAYILVSRNNSSTSAMWLIKASACCNLAAVGVSAVKMVLDLMHIFVSFRRRIRQLMLKRSSPTVGRRGGDLSVVDVVDAAPFSPSDREQQHQLGVEMPHTSQLSPSVVTSQLLSMESSNLSAGGGSFSTCLDAINPSSFHSVPSAYLDGADAAAAAALGASNSSISSPPRHQSSTPVADDLMASFASSTARAMRRADERYWDPSGAARAATTTTTRITSARKGFTSLQDDDELL